jgi:LysR family glycine cleavage system transcriptional activator
VPAHDLVGSDDRAFWYLYPAARQHSQKLKAFGEWIEDQASAARTAGATFIRRAKAG